MKFYSYSSLKSTERRCDEDGVKISKKEDTLRLHKYHTVQQKSQIHVKHLSIHTTYRTQL